MHRRAFLHRSVLAISVVTPSVSARDIQVSSPGFELFDTHAHFVTNDIATYPLHAGNANESEAKLTGRVMNNPTTVERILDVWDANGVSSGVGVQYRSAYQFDNSYLLDVATRFPRRIVPVVIFDTLDPATPEILRATVRSKGVVGIRMTGFADKNGDLPWLDSEAALRTWEVANDLKLAVVLMPLPPGGSGNALRHVALLAQHFPAVRIVLDHIGWPAAVGAPGFGLSSEHLALAKTKNVFYKWTTINLENLKSKRISSSGYLRHLVSIYGADHIMWGSDFGNTLIPYADMINEVIASTKELTTKERQQILSKTGRMVFSHRS